MLKLNYAELQNPAFMGALHKLAGVPMRNVKCAYNLSRLLDKVGQEHKLAQTVFIKTLKGFAKLDANGEIAPHDGRPGTFEIIPEKKAEWEKAAKEFDAIEFTVDRHPIKLSDLHAEGVPVSAGELAALDRILDADDVAKMDAPADSGLILPPPGIVKPIGKPKA
jgi:hypothetical protein